MHLESEGARSTRNAFGAGRSPSRHQSLAAPVVAQCPRSRAMNRRNLMRRRRVAVSIALVMTATLGGGVAAAQTARAVKVTVLSTMLAGRSEERRVGKEGRS